MRTELRFDAEGDFHDLHSYEQLFRDLLAKAQIADAVVEARGADENDDEPGFSIYIRAGGKELTFTSKAEPEEWVDEEFFLATATELGKALGFTVKQVNTDDQCMAVRISR